jgi:predicted phosphate transport protein (TIGR00153 family)
MTDHSDRPITQPPLPRLRKFISNIRLFPKTHDFFVYFEKSSEQVLSGARLLRKMIDTPKEGRAPLLKELKDIEHEGDKITHDTIDLVRSTFLTPFDRTDIHSLAVELDDILDVIYHIGNRLTRYGIVAVPVELKQLCDFGLLGCEEIQKAIKELRNTKDSVKIIGHCREVNRIEKQADDMLNVALEMLFNKQFDPYEVIKLKELGESLETATDKCKNVANIIEGIILKHA